MQHSHYGDINIDLRMHDDCRCEVRRRLKELLDLKLERQSEPKPGKQASSELIVWDVVARWGATQTLGHIYSDPGVKDKFYTFEITRPFEFNNFNFATPGDIGLGPCHARARTATKPMNAHNIARLYTAVSALWLLQELELAALTAYWETSTDLSTTRGQIANTVHILITSISDALDLVEATDFLLSFCLERLFIGCDNAHTWLCLTSWHRQSSRTSNGLLPQTARGVIQRILRPSDILELVLLSARSPDLSAIDKGKYLFDRGIYDYTMGYDGYCIGDGTRIAPQRTQGFTSDFGEKVLQSWLEAMYAPGSMTTYNPKSFINTPTTQTTTTSRTIANLTTATTTITTMAPPSNAVITVSATATVSPTNGTTVYITTATNTSRPSLIGPYAIGTGSNASHAAGGGGAFAIGTSSSPTPHATFPPLTSMQGSWAPLQGYVSSSWKKYRGEMWRKELKGRLFEAPAMTQGEIGEGVLRRCADNWLETLMNMKVHGSI